VVGVVLLDAETILSWSRDNTLRTWDRGGNELAQFAGHSSNVIGAVLLDAETILSWSRDNTLRTWDRGGNQLWGWHTDYLITF